MQLPCEIVGCPGIVAEESGECDTCHAAHGDPCRDCGCRLQHADWCAAERSADRAADADRERDDEQSICDDFAADHGGIW